MNLKKLFGRAKRAIDNSSTTSSTSTRRSSPIFACSHREAPPIRMGLRTTTESLGRSLASACSRRSAASHSGSHLSALQLSAPDDSLSTPGTQMSDVLLLSVGTSPASTQRPNAKAAGDGSQPDPKETEEAVLKAWGKNQELKKLAIPTDYPDYMREAPPLAYSETETSQLRRKYIAQKIESYKHRPLKRNAKLLQPGPQPKLNRASSLRKSYIGRQPIMSERFRSHYSLYHRPPFRHTNVKLVY